MLLKSNIQNKFEIINKMSWYHDGTVEKLNIVEGLFRIPTNKGKNNFRKRDFQFKNVTKSDHPFGSYDAANRLTS